MHILLERQTISPLQQAEPENREEDDKDHSLWLKKQSLIVHKLINKVLFYFFRFVWFQINI